MDAEHIRTFFGQELSQTDNEEEVTPKRRAPKAIERLDGENSLFNSDDKLLVRDGLDFVFRIEEVSYLPKILSVLWQEEVGNDAAYQDYLSVKQTRDTPGSASVIVQTGCDNFCSFCIVPHTRGREMSRPVADILQEVQEAANAGIKEVVLLGQNVNSYGKESRKKLWNAESLTWVSSDVQTPFRELINAVSDVQGIERIRYTSSNPHDMTRDILSAPFERKNVARMLHFALQSGSDAVLKRMNRKHTFADFLTQVQYLRSQDPFFAITTDIIVGFPGETEEEFMQTVEAFRQCEFDFAYIARYSPRRGTYSADKLADTVSLEEKARRWDILNQMLKASVIQRNQMSVGKEATVLISRETETTFGGRTEYFKEVFFPKVPGIMVGQMVRVRLTGVDEWVLTGEYIA